MAIQQSGIKSALFSKLSDRMMLYSAFLILLVCGLIVFAVIQFHSISSLVISENQVFSNRTIGLTESALKAQGEEYIRETAFRRSDAIREFVLSHPNMTMAQLTDDKELNRRAVQKVGLTGYTAVHDRSGINHFHSNPAIVGVDLRTLSSTLPDFWDIIEASLVSESSGYYGWKDPDGSIRQKYMYCAPVPDTEFIVCATTYIDEFFAPLVLLRKDIDNIFSSINTKVQGDVSRVIFLSVLLMFIISITIMVISAFFIRKISAPINEIHNAAVRLGEGDFSVRLSITSGDEFEDLSRTFNKTVEALHHADIEKRQVDSAKTRFLSITSHELRSPMTPMKAQLQMLQKGYFGSLNHKQSEAIDIIYRNTDRLDKIISDFLEISRIEAARLKFNFVRANLADHVKRLVEEMKAFLPEKNIDIILQMGKLPAIEVDPDRIMQVLRNLINNAKKFSPPDTKILVDVRLKEGMIRFSVKDQGIGVKLAEQRKLFEPFYQAEQTIYRQYGGAGLGLSICKGIIESQHGRIWLESTPGKGSTFCFTVPLVPVREPKPIRILFSEEEEKTRLIELIFNDVLGPIGSSEFEEVRKGGISKENLYTYIGSLSKNGIITKEAAGVLRKRVNSVLSPKHVGEEKEESHAVKDIEDFFNKR